jgi:hypothetical protein
MRIFQMVVAGATTVLAVAVAGCSHSTPSTSKSGSATSAPSSNSSASTSAAAAPGPAGDYGKLLIQASDIQAPVPFTAGPPTNNPNGQPGVATTFKDEDGSHLIKDTILVYADSGAATDALNAAKGQQGNAVKDPQTQPSNIGTGGTLLLGNSPDKAKGVTILLFTEGKALVTLEFDGPAESLAPPEFVTDVGQKQDVAVKNGLGS